MGGLSIWHWMIVLLVVLLLFGGGSGKISGIMGDFAKGIKSFKKNMADDEKMDTEERPAGSIAAPNAPAASSAAREPARHS